MIGVFMDYCHSKALRPKTMQSYEQSLKLFAAWMRADGESTLTSYSYRNPPHAPFHTEHAGVLY